MKNLSIKLSVVVILLSLFHLNSQAQIAEQIALTNDNQLLGLGHYKRIKSEILQEDRPIIISLPEGYEQGNANYPVLYLLDGLGNIKHQVGTMSMLTEAGLIPPMIIVGVESLNRSRDLTPSKGGKNSYGGTGNDGIDQSGGAPTFLKFLEEELIPYVESNYRTHPYRVLEGHSFGGLFSVYTLMEKTELFDAFIVQSPALWWNNEEMTEKAKTFFKSKKQLNKAIYFGIGGGDGWGMRQELIRYTDVIRNNEPQNLHWMHEEVGDEGHDSARLLLNYFGLKFIFSDLKPTKEFHENFSDKAFLKAERQLIKKYGSKVKRPVTDYANLAIKLMNNGNDLGAITVLSRTSDAYPKYFDILTTLAKLYEKTHRIEQAITTYKRAIKVSDRFKLGMKSDFQKEIERLKKS